MKALKRMVVAFLVFGMGGEWALAARTTAMSETLIVKTMACSSSESASELYWSAWRYGQREALSLLPRHVLSDCFWGEVRLPVTLGYCQFDFFLDCANVFVLTRKGPVYFVLWPQ